MTRRDLGALLVVLLAGRGTAVAGSGQGAIVGILAPGPLRPIASFKQRLRELGWIEGRNIRFEDRWAEEDDTRYGALAAELTAIPVDAILTWSTPAVLAAKLASTRVPIVMGAIADPIGVGAVSSLAHPGGNVTGFSTQNFELEEKRFELLRELVPRMARIAMLGNAANPYSGTGDEALKDAGRSRRTELRGRQHRRGGRPPKQP
jgi:putative ABC transport system substrate-binding protein